MTTAGEAASLFGAADSSSDPFSLGESDAQHELFTDELQTNQNTASTTDLFGASTTEDASYFPSQPAYQPESSDGYYAPDDYSNPNETAQYHGYNAPTASTGDSQYNTYPGTHAASGWNNAQSQAQGYEPPYSPAVHGVSQPYYGTTHAPHYNTSSTSYAPQTDFATPSTNATSYTPYASYDTAKYDIPSIPVPPVLSVYDPYKPSQTSVYNQPPPIPASSYSAYSGSIQTSIGTVSEVPPVAPPRSASSAAIYRPKTSNAYDPPLPPPKPVTRRSSAWQPPHSPAVQSMYPLPRSPAPHGQAVPPPLPPPPRSSSTSVPPPVPEHPTMRQYASPPPSQQTRPSTVFPYGSPPMPPPGLPRQSLSPPLHKEPPVSTGSGMTYYMPNHSVAIPANPYAPSQPLPPVTNGSTYTSAVPAPSVLYNQYNNEPIETQKLNAQVQPTSGQTRFAEESAPMTHTEPERAVSPFANAATFVGHQPPPYGQAGIDLEELEGSWQPISSGTRSPEPVYTAPEDNRISTQHAGEEPHGTRPYVPTTVPHAGLSQQSPYERSPERTRSPGSSSVRSWTSSQGRSNSGLISPPRAPAQGRSSIDSHSGRPPATYTSPVIATTHRTASPSSFSIRSSHGRESPILNPYAPQSSFTSSSNLRDRSMSINSALSSSSAVLDDPYAPSRHPRQLSFEHSSYENFSAVPRPDDSGPYATTMLAASHSQVVTLGAPTAAPYAPSPSLLGTNDPLGRTSVRIPIVSFGFGGKLLTCFHGSSSLSTGFDVAMSSRASTSIHIRPLHGTIPQSALDTSAAVYPGPLFSDPGTPTTGLVRTGAATQTKTKKARVVKYLEERAEEISRGLGYLHQGSAEGLRAEAKRVLINLLKVMVENDGHLSGSSQIDSAVRAALLPELAASDKAEDNLTTPALGFAHIAESRPGYSDSSDTAVSIHTLRTSHLDKIQQLLLRGERRAAYQYAADEKLWAHAMVISSSIDKEAWKEVVNEFVRAEMASNSPSLGAASSAESHAIAANGREPLRVAYSLFAGHGSAAVQELLPPKPLTSLTHTLQVPTTTSAALTPMSPNFPKVIQMSPIPTEILSKWTETVAMMITSPLSMETSSALTTLGDQLAANKWVEAAHSCYLLSPQTSPVGGVGMPAVRVVLYGAPNSQTVPHFWKDPDPVIFSEIVEFALSLATPIKGQDAYAGIPTLQPYKLIRAAYLAEMGHVQLANRYCEAISSSLTRSSPYLNNTFIEQLKDLTDRLVAAPLVDKSGSWIGSKMTRPSLDKIGNWLEGRLTSFIAGEGDSPKPEDPHAREHSFSGPFAHYSTISSATSSTIPSPQMSTTNLTEIHSASLPARTGSAMALRPPSAQAQIARASSAMDYLRRKASPVPRMSSASAVNSSFTDLPPWGQNTNGYGIVPEATPKADRKSKLAEVQVEEEEGAPETPSGPQLGAWWGADSSAPTPTALSFGYGATLQAPTDGFISLMDDAPLSPAYGSQAKALSPSERSGSYQYDEDDDDDLGLGNNVNRLALKPEAPKEVAQKPAPEPPKSEPEAEKPAAASGGWLSRLWKRGDAAPPGPVKANLGEQSSFYYDKDLKRWVNKNAGTEAVKPAAPPPPPQRSQTASPGMSAARSPTTPSPGPPPPARPATANANAGPKPPMRVRSNLVPPEVSSAPTTPAPSSPLRISSTMSDGPPGMDVPPTPGVRSRPAAKRNARSRYVDVFQQEGSS